MTVLLALGWLAAACFCSCFFSSFFSGSLVEDFEVSVVAALDALVDVSVVGVDVPVLCVAVLPAVVVAWIDVLLTDCTAWSAVLDAGAATLTWKLAAGAGVGGVAP